MTLPTPDNTGDPKQSGGSQNGNGNRLRDYRLDHLDGTTNETQQKVDTLISSVAVIEDKFSNMATKSDIQLIKTEIATSENKFLWKLSGLMVTGIAAIAAILRYLAP